MREAQELGSQIDPIKVAPFSRRKFSFSEYTLPKVYEVSEALARQSVRRAGGKIEKDAQGDEILVIPVQTPQPGLYEKGYAPGPAADSQFTPEEMARIKPPPAGKK